LKFRSSLGVLGTILALTLLVSCADKNLRQGKIMLKNVPPDFAGAIEQFKLSLQSNPKNGEAYFFLGKSYAELDQYPEMNEAFDKAMELNPVYKAEALAIREQKWNLLFNNGLEDVKKEDYQSAITKFEICMVIDPSKYESYSNAGFVASKLADSPKAYDYNKRAYELKNDDPVIVRNFAAICFAQEKYPEALQIYDVAKKLEPKNTNINIRMGQIHERTGNYPLAAAAYADALKIDPNNPDLWFNLGVLYLQQLEDLPKAENAFSEAIRVNPEDNDAAFNLILVKIKLAKFQEAVPVVQRLELKDPGNCDVYDLMATVYSELGDKKMINEAIAKGKKCRGEK